MTLPSTVANPQELAVTSSAVVAVVAPAACTSVTVQQQQGSDPPSHKYNLYQANLSTQIGSTQNGGAGYTFVAPTGSFFAAGQTVGGVELPSTDSGTMLMSVFANVAPGGQLPPGISLSQRAVITLTSAQLLAIQTTAVQVLPAPPPGYAIILRNAMFNYVYGTTAYTIGNANNVLQFEYTGKSTSLLQASVTGLADQTANGLIAGSSPLTTELASTAVTGLGLEIKLTGSSAALTLGNGTIAVIFDYSLLSIS
jgi:hypothetical protein